MLSSNTVILADKIIEVKYVSIKMFLHVLAPVVVQHKFTQTIENIPRRI